MPYSINNKIKSVIDFEYFFSTHNTIAFVIDREGTIIKGNDAALYFTGRNTHDEIQGLPIVNYFYNLQDTYSLLTRLKVKSQYNFVKLENIKVKATSRSVEVANIILKPVSHKLWFLVMELPINNIGSEPFESGINEKIQTIISQSKILHVLIDRNFNLAYFNKASSIILKSLTGIDLKLGMNIFSLIPEMKLPDFKRKFEDCLTNKTIVDEYKHIDKNTTGRWFKTVYTPVIDENGKVDSVLITVEEITESKCIEVAHEEKRQELRQIIDLVPHYIIAKDEDGNIILTNKKFADSFGMTPKELVGKNQLDIAINIEEVHRALAQDKMVIETGETFIDFEDIHTDINGEVHYLNTKKVPFVHNGKKAVLVVSDDITELRKTQLSLFESEEKYRNLIQNQGEGAIIIDKFKTISFANPAAEAIFECNQKELLGKKLSDFMDIDSYARFIDEIKYIKQGKSRTFELDITADSGLRKILLITITPNYKSDKNFNDYFGIFRDITDRKLAEKALEMSEIRLKDLNATKDKFFNIIAHDLKNPFGSISGFSELAKKKIKNGDFEGILQYLEYIEMTSRHGHSLLENLLEWSRSQSGALKPKIVPFNFSELLRHHVMFLQNIASYKEIAIEPSIEEGILVNADKNMISTVLRNLISNAIKYSNRGNIIWVDAGIKNNYAEVTIRDEGVGMTEKDISNLFRIDETISRTGTEKETGTGLGLIVCKEFIEKNKGDIRVISTPGKGSSFTFTIPLII
jgi:PAS domain S-box-containing protein